MILKVVLFFVCLHGLSLVVGEDSEVRTIRVPYEASARQVRKVVLPGEAGTDLGVNENRDVEKGSLVKLLNGTYMVYYTTGMANGKFNGMIAVLDE